MASSLDKVLDMRPPEAEHSPRTRMAVPNLILIGYGVTDSLQLTVESQRLLARYGMAYSIGLPPNLAAFLKSQRVKVTDLGGCFAQGRDYAEAYLDIAHALIARTASERPVIFLAPGNPMVFNAVGRYLVMEGKRLGLSVQVVAAVSPLDMIISGIGLDVSTFGLQVFDATRLVSRSMPISPAVPAVLMHLGGFAGNRAPGATTASDLEPLVGYLARIYPGDHPAAVVKLGASGMRVASFPLGQLNTAAGEVDSGSHLFVDAVRRAQPQEPLASQAIQANS